MKQVTTYTLLTITLLIIGIVFFSQVKSCSSERQTIDLKKDTVERISIVPRNIYIKDTIKVKAVAWKTKDSMIFVDKEIPCNDTAFIVQADSVIVPTGDTLQVAFSYAQRSGNFSLLFKPRPDSIKIKEILKIEYVKESFPYGTVFGAIGLGVLLGVAATSQNK